MYTRNVLVHSIQKEFAQEWCSCPQPEAAASIGACSWELHSLLTQCRDDPLPPCTRPERAAATTSYCHSLCFVFILIYLRLLVLETLQILIYCLQEVPVSPSPCNSRCTWGDRGPSPDARLCHQAQTHPPQLYNLTQTRCPSTCQVT